MLKGKMVCKAFILPKCNDGVSECGDSCGTVAVGVGVPVGDKAGGRSVGVNLDGEREINKWGLDDQELKEKALIDLPTPI